ncbi:hypothetical protein GF359_04820 [candidate division WOR-3 bacterium]|uniref:Uncharacterized protein n=1 Tax=candidate division WOR-3 bacterium TaxID=2052148 RepID=A0A9D5K8P7_UNCW3|nr:hypothetical protein [candidate division WOR-3 bacterium]MBD3364518.1 hypothetical protein [candidate division WOR-3 bacterium]
MKRIIRKWIWLPVALLMVAACIVGIMHKDGSQLRDILRNATTLCESCIGIG